jgi:hypothetical protein
MTLPLPQSFEMMADLGTVTVCRMDAAIDYAAAVSSALREHRDSAERLNLLLGMDNVALRSALKTAEAALADIGDATREPGDDLAWCEARAAQALPAVRAALKGTT